MADHFADRLRIEGQDSPGSERKHRIPSQRLATECIDRVRVEFAVVSRSHSQVSARFAQP
jgi:hypothetical protein